MTAAKQVISGTVDQATIDKWKAEVIAKYGPSAKVWCYTTEDGNKVAYVRSVDRATYSAATAKITSNPALFNETIIQNIWLGGDEDVRNVDQYYFGLIDFVETLMAKKKGNLTEL